MDKWIGFKGLKLLSGERGSEEKKRFVFPELGDQKDSLTSEGLSRAAGGELSLGDLGVKWCCHIPVTFGLSEGCWLATILVQKLPGWKTVFCVQQIFVFYPEPLTFALSRPCFLSNSIGCCCCPALIFGRGFLEGAVRGRMLCPKPGPSFCPFCMTPCRALHKLFWLPGEISAAAFPSGQHTELLAGGLRMASAFLSQQGV